MDEIIIVPDVHCRNFYKPVLEIKDKPIVFLGDYLDPYNHEGFSFTNGIENLKEIIEFAKNNPHVTLLVGNHDTSYIWSDLGICRFNYEQYDVCHKLFRDNISLFKPIHRINNLVFTHAGISEYWIKQIFEEIPSIDVIEQYINNEWNAELELEIAVRHFGYYCLKSYIFAVGYARGGDAPYGGPFWCDLSETKNPFSEIQITGHNQLRDTGNVIDVSAIYKRNDSPIYDCDSRTIFIWKNNNLEKYES